MRAGGGPSKWHAYVYADGVATNLNSLIPAGSGLHLAFGSAINNAGQIVGTAVGAQGRYHAVPAHPRRSRHAGPSASAMRCDWRSRRHSHGEPHSFALVHGQRPVTVSFGTADGSAAAGIDYPSASGFVTFDPGDTSRDDRARRQRRPRRRAQRDVPRQPEPGTRAELSSATVKVPSRLPMTSRASPSAMCRRSEGHTGTTRSCLRSPCRLRPMRPSR